MTRAPAPTAPAAATAASASESIDAPAIEAPSRRRLVLLLAGASSAPGALASIASSLARRSVSSMSALLLAPAATDVIAFDDVQHRSPTDSCTRGRETSSDDGPSRDMAAAPGPAGAWPLKVIRRVNRAGVGRAIRRGRLGYATSERRAATAARPTASMRYKVVIASGVAMSPS